MQRLVRAALAAAMLVLLAPAPAAAASPTPGFGVEASPARIDFKLKPGQTEIAAKLALVNRGSSPILARVSAIDVVIDKAGAWQQLPAGSTPYGFPSLLTVQVVELPVGKIVTLDLKAQLRDLRPMLGGILVEPLDPGSSASSGTAIAFHPDLLIPLTAAEVDSKGIVQGVELSGRPAGLELPRFQESGPVSATSSAVNTSSFYERAFTTVTYSNFGHTYLTVQEPPVGTFPGGTARSAATSIVTAPGAAPFDVTPWFGLIQVTATTHMTLLDSTAPPIVQTGWVIVAPWRLLLGLLGLLVAGALVWRLRRRSA